MRTFGPHLPSVRKLHGRFAIFCFFVVLYSFFGMVISYKTGNPSNLYFGLDTSRAYGDLTEIDFNHFRIMVHPLFLLLMQPPVSIIGGLFASKDLALIFIQSCCGAISAAIVFSILEEKGCGFALSLIGTLIYGFSFSQLTLVTLTDTYVFSNCALTVSWGYFILKCGKGKGWLSKWELLILVLLGAFCFGITLTNYAWYCIGLIYLGVRRFGKLHELWLRLLGLIVVELILFVMLNALQSFLWPNCPMFWEEIYQGLIGEGYRELRYTTNHSLAQSAEILSQQTIMYPMLAPSLSLNPNPVAYFEVSGISCVDCDSVVLWGDYHPFVLIVLVVSISAAIIAYIRYVAQMVARRSVDLEFTCLAAIWLGNMALHSTYATGESFIFTAHFYFALVIMTCIAIKDLPLRQVTATRIAFIVAICFTVFLASNNVDAFMQAVSICQTASGAHHSLKKAAYVAGLCGLISTICALWLSLQRKSILSAIGKICTAIYFASIAIYCCSLPLT